MIIDFWGGVVHRLQGARSDRLGRSARAGGGGPVRRGEKLDGTDGSDAFQALSEKYGIVGMPTVIFIDPRGFEVPERVTGAISADEMIGVARGRARVRGRPGCRDAAAGALACAARW